MPKEKITPEQIFDTLLELAKYIQHSNGEGESSDLKFYSDLIIRIAEIRATEEMPFAGYTDKSRELATQVESYAADETVPLPIRRIFYGFLFRDQTQLLAQKTLLEQDINAFSQLGNYVLFPPDSNTDIKRTCRFNAALSSLLTVFKHYGFPSRLENFKPEFQEEYSRIVHAIADQKDHPLHNIVRMRLALGKVIAAFTWNNEVKATPALVNNKTVFENILKGTSINPSL